MLPYGLNRDWIRNLTAAGCARVQRYGKTVAVTNPRIVPFVCDALVLRLELRLVVLQPVRAAQAANQTVSQGIRVLFR
jgi:hypothetical protein